MSLTAAWWPGEARRASLVYTRRTSGARHAASASPPARAPGRRLALGSRVIQRERAYTQGVISWCKTPDGWAVNLDGTSAAGEFSLPRIELHSGPHGWTSVFHRQNGTSLLVKLAGAASAPDAKRAAAQQALLTVGAQYEPELRALLGHATA